jgi:hypothetical protein
MTHDILLFSMPYDASMKPLRLPGEVWTKVLAAAQVHGGLVQERFNASEARQFAHAVRAALEPPPASPAPTRFAVFSAAKADSGLPLREPEVRPLVDQVLEVFEQGSVLVQRATESALRALSGANVPGGGGVGRKAPVQKPTEKLRGLSASEVLGPAER